MKTSAFFAVGLLAATATANPQQSDNVKRANAAAVSILQKIAPNSATCDGSGTAPTECIDASDAATPLIDSFEQYKITTPAEQAALLSWMAYESADFKYDRNHFPSPGRPGQGTRCMMMPTFVTEFAATLNVTDTDPATLLNKTIAAGGDWTAASWFYTTKCTDAIKTGVQSGGKAGWQAFVTQCVQTTLDTGTNSREAYWTRAAQALGMSTS